MKPIFVALFVFLSMVIFSQTKKSVEAIYINTPINIDANLNEPSYSIAQPAKDFLQIQPLNGKPSCQPSEVYFFYDNTSIYVGAMLHDKKDSIFNFLSERDNIGMSDYFGVYFDPYNQGQLAYGFFITPAGVQVDIKASKTNDGDSEDGSWNAVWESKTRITENGWIVEMRIPYSALRFPDNQLNAWGLNMFRNFRRHSSNNSWNLIDRKVNSFINQEGELTGIKNIKPPMRLSLSPYIAAYFEPESSTGTSQFLYKGGLDLKYGINESFTLDMMVIPDFGQIQSDDKNLNLSPFEIYYDEKRQFFTEGTELFQRGNIFYSRRIGASPKFSANNALKENEVVNYNPSETQLVNAVKISGRTNNDWGIGVANAMSLPSYAILKNTTNETTRKVLVQPFTNYNVAVVDKSLPNNSYLSLINTNVSMYDNPFHANVTATEFQLYEKSKTYALTGKGAFSTRGDSITENGYYAKLGIEKKKGKLFFGVNQSVYSDKYNPNDLGYLHHNNQLTTEAWVFSQIVKPFWIFREIQGDLWWNYNRMYKPNTLFDNEAGFDSNAKFKNNYILSIKGKYNTNQFDYYEPRVQGKYFFNPYFYELEIFLSSDSRKPLSLGMGYEYKNQPTTGHYKNSIEADARWRIGQHLGINYSTEYSKSNNERGFASLNQTQDSIVFARRNVTTLINTLNTSYVINNKTSLSLRARHYWSGVENNQYYLLNSQGNLSDCCSYTKDIDQNYNAFTIDMIFRWIFAPGSEMSLAWKALSYSNENIVDYNYRNNLQKAWQNQTNSISLKILYYIDYNNLVKVFKKTGR